MASSTQRSFSGGEIAPALYARVDQSKYATGLKTCRNMMVMRHGGVYNRPGTKWIGEVKDSSKTVRLVPFVFNSDQTYVLEFGNLYMRVIRNGVQLTNTAQPITAITNANPGMATYSGADTILNGDIIYISGVVGAMAKNINGRSFKVAGLDQGAKTFLLNTLAGANFNTTSLGAYTSGGTFAEYYQITTPYLEADLMALNFVQSADVITIVHPSYQPRELTRSGHTSWALNTVTISPEQAAPTNVATSTAGLITDPVRWAVVAVNSDTGEESLYSVTVTGAATAPTTGAPASITWTAPAGNISHYNIYRSDKATSSPTKPYGFIGIAYASGFQDNGITPDYLDTPPENRNPFVAGAGDWPSAVTYSQGRIFYANSNNDPERAWASQSGRFHNFISHIPVQDDDAITFTMAGRQVNEIRHMIELGSLIMLTSSAELVIQGGADGVIRPAEINPKQFSSNGTGDLFPLVVNDTLLYLQARGTIIRDFGFDFNVDGYRGNDLTIFSAHLFDDYTIRDWTYQQTPHSIVWAARSDGTLLGLTYVREHQVWAWHRHDFQDATVENVCSVPEGTEDALYLVIKRTINGATVRYIERLQTRKISAIEDSILMDSALTYDGTNAGATTMTLSGGTAWSADEALTLTASASAFVSTDVGNRIDLESATGVIIRCTISLYTSPTVVTVHAHKDVPANLRSTARTTWVRAADEITGLWHLEGETVSVLGDGFVVASPNNKNPDTGDATYTTVTVANGLITLPRPYGVVQVGLPYISDIETLDIDQAAGETLANKQKQVTQVTAFVDESRGMWVGSQPPTDDDVNPLEGLTEAKVRDDESMDDPVQLSSGKLEVEITAEWNSNGRVFIRQVDPLPLAILAVVPTGYIPLGG